MKKTPYRHLAHVRAFADTPIVYFTVVTFDRRSLLAQPAVHEILVGIFAQAGERNGWWVGDYIVMPDHLHFFARAGRDAEPMAEWVGMWKSLSARRISQAIAVPPPIWQEEYFDRYLRSSEDYSAKWSYVERNALDADLVTSIETWPYRGRIHDLRF